jgi:hypothetical protein
MRDETVFCVTNSRYHANPSSDRVFFHHRCNALTIVFGRFPSPSPLPRGFSGHVARPSRSIQRFNAAKRYSSLLGQCLRLVSYATGALPHLRLRAFHRRSSLPSLCYRIGSDSVAGP